MSRAEAAFAPEGLPVIGRITSRFTVARRHPLLGVVRPHHGVDIAAPSGTPITTPSAGRVIFAGRKVGFGNVVEIDHGLGVVTRYAHCRTINVKAGAQVEPGATIATVGKTGLASGPHLHFEVLVNGRSIDPLKQSLPALLESRATPAPAPQSQAGSRELAASREAREGAPERHPIGGVPVDSAVAQENVREEQGGGSSFDLPDGGLGIPPRTAPDGSDDNRR